MSGRKRFNSWRWRQYRQGVTVLGEEAGWFALEREYRLKLEALIEEEEKFGFLSDRFVLKLKDLMDEYNPMSEWDGL